MAKPIYLDYAAATPVDRRVLAAMQPYLTDEFYNPSATYLAGRRVRQALAAARADVARQLGARPAEITFTAGATEANNLAIKGVMSQFPDGELLISAVEHKSVSQPAKAFARRLIPVTPKGVVDLVKLAKLVGNRTVLVSVMYVNNELGSVQPIREIAQLLAEVRRHRRSARPLYLHSDAAQAANYLDLSVSRLGVDLLTINGGKIYGPKQTGALYAAAGVRLQPQIDGGGQEYGRRSGTENAAGAIGLAKALQLARAGRAAEAKRLTGLRQQFISDLTAAIPTVIIHGDARHSAPHIVSASFPGQDNERLMMALDEAGVMVAVGSACSAADSEPSAVLRAIGLSDELARATLRFSFGRMTTAAQLSRVVKLLRQLT